MILENPTAECELLIKNQNVSEWLSFDDRPDKEYLGLKVNYCDEIKPYSLLNVEMATQGLHESAQIFLRFCRNYKNLVDNPEDCPPSNIPDSIIKILEMDNELFSVWYGQFRKANLESAIQNVFQTNELNRLKEVGSSTDKLNYLAKKQYEKQSIFSTQILNNSQ